MANKVLGSLSTLALRIFIILAALAIVASEMAFAIDDKEHWNSTSITDTDLRQFINSENCYKNENNFLGCIDAINSLLAASKPEKILSNKQIESLPEMKAIVGVVERVQIRIHEPQKLDNKNLVDSWKASSQTRAQINHSWKTLYSVQKNSPISFEKLFQNALALADKTHVKATLADSVNAFFRSSVDPHTYITPTSKWNESLANSEKRLIGAGINIQKLDDQYILKPMENSPALQSGIKNMDTLQKVDGKNTAAMTLDQIGELIRGKENTPVVLTISRKGALKDITVIRAAFVIKTIDSKLLTDPFTNKKIGYIKLASFMEQGVCKKFADLAVSLQKQGAETLVLDLRDNGGGLLDEALCMAALYLDKGQVMLTQNNPTTNKIMETHTANGNAGVYRLFKNKPLFIMQSAYSASASEVLAGALVSYGRAITIGERSYGKGTVQQSQDSIQDIYTGIKMMKTVSRFHFASGASNQIVGIPADILAYSKPNPTSNDKFAIREIDNYPNAIISAQPPKGFGAHAIAAIKKCIGNRNLISSEYNQDSDSAVASDYQLLMAREVASCQM